VLRDLLIRERDNPTLVRLPAGITQQIGKRTGPLNNASADSVGGIPERQGGLGNGQVIAAAL
jgi:hypothetical protein